MSCDIYDALIHATVFCDGAEVLTVSACYVYMMQDLQGVLPPHVSVEWGPDATAAKKAVSSAPTWVGEAARNGRLALGRESLFELYQGCDS